MPAPITALRILAGARRTTSVRRPSFARLVLEFLERRDLLDATPLSAAPSLSVSPGGLSPDGRAALRDWLDTALRDNLGHDDADLSARLLSVLARISADAGRSEDLSRTLAERIKAGEDLRDDLQDLGPLLGEHRDDRDSDLATLRRAAETFARRRDELQALQEQSQGLQGERTGLLEQQASLTRTITALTQQLVDAASAVAADTARRAALDRSLGELTAQRDALIRSLADLSSRQDALPGQIASAAVAVRQADAQVQEANRALGNALAAVAALEAQVAGRSEASLTSDRAALNGALASRTSFAVTLTQAAALPALRAVNATVAAARQRLPADLRVALQSALDADRLAQQLQSLPPARRRTSPVFHRSQAASTQAQRQRQALHPRMRDTLDLLFPALRSLQYATAPALPAWRQTARATVVRLNQSLPALRQDFAEREGALTALGRLPQARREATDAAQSLGRAATASADAARVLSGLQDQALGVASAIAQAQTDAGRVDAQITQVRGQMRDLGDALAGNHARQATLATSLAEARARLVHGGARLEEIDDLLATLAGVTQDQELLGRASALVEGATEEYQASLGRILEQMRAAERQEELASGAPLGRVADLRAEAGRLRAALAETRPRTTIETVREEVALQLVPEYSGMMEGRSEEYGGTRGVSTTSMRQSVVQVGQQYWIYGARFLGWRAALRFDAASIPAGATITGAALTLQGVNKVNTTGEQTALHVVRVAGGLLTTASLGSVGYDQFLVGSANAIALDPALLQVDGSGALELGLRVTQDISGKAPAMNANNAYAFYLGDIASAESRPALTVTYALEKATTVSEPVLTGDDRARAEADLSTVEEALARALAESPLDEEPVDPVLPPSAALLDLLSRIRTDALPALQAAPAGRRPQALRSLLLGEIDAERDQRVAALLPSWPQGPAGWGGSVDARASTMLNDSAVTASGRTLVGAYNDGTIELRDTHSGQVRASLQTGIGRAYYVSAHPTQDIVYVSAGELNGVLIAVDGTSGRELWRQPTGGWANRSSVSPDGTLVVLDVDYGATQACVTFDAASGAPRGAVTPAGNYGAGTALNGGAAAFFRAGSEVYLRDASGQRLLTSLPGLAYDAAVAADGRTLAVAAGPTVEIIELASGARQSLAAGGKVNCLAFAEGKLLLGLDNHAVEVWSLAGATPALERTLAAAAPVRDVAIRDGRLYARTGGEFDAKWLTESLMSPDLDMPDLDALAAEVRAFTRDQMRAWSAEAAPELSELLVGDASEDLSPEDAALQAAFERNQRTAAVLASLQAGAIISSAEERAALVAALQYVRQFAEGALERADAPLDRLSPATLAASLVQRAEDLGEAAQLLSLVPLPSVPTELQAPFQALWGRLRARDEVLALYRDRIAELAGAAAQGTLQAGMIEELLRTQVVPVEFTAIQNAAEWYGATGKISLTAGSIRLLSIGAVAPFSLVQGQGAEAGVGLGATVTGIDFTALRTAVTGARLRLSYSGAAPTVQVYRDGRRVGSVVPDAEGVVRIHDVAGITELLVTRPDSAAVKILSCTITYDPTRPVSEKPPLSPATNRDVAQALPPRTWGNVRPNQRDPRIFYTNEDGYTLLTVSGYGKDATISSVYYYVSNNETRGLDPAYVTRIDAYNWLLHPGVPHQLYAQVSGASIRFRGESLGYEWEYSQGTRFAPTSQELLPTGPLRVRIDVMGLKAQVSDPTHYFLNHMPTAGFLDSFRTPVGTSRVEMLAEISNTGAVGGEVRLEYFGVGATYDPTELGSPQYVDQLSMAPGGKRLLVTSISFPGVQTETGSVVVRITYPDGRQEVVKVAGTNPYRELSHSRLVIDPDTGQPTGEREPVNPYSVDEQERILRAQVRLANAFRTRGKTDEAAGLLAGIPQALTGGAAVNTIAEEVQRDLVALGIRSSVTPAPTPQAVPASAIAPLVNADALIAMGSYATTDTTNPGNGQAVLGKVTMKKMVEDMHGAAGLTQRLNSGPVSLGVVLAYTDGEFNWVGAKNTMAGRVALWLGDMLKPTLHGTISQTMFDAPVYSNIFETVQNITGMDPRNIKQTLLDVLLASTQPLANSDLARAIETLFNKGQYHEAFGGGGAEAHPNRYVGEKAEDGSLLAESLITYKAGESVRIRFDAPIDSWGRAITAVNIYLLDATGLTQYGDDPIWQGKGGDLFADIPVNHIVGRAGRDGAFRFKVGVWYSARWEDHAAILVRETAKVDSPAEVRLLQMKMVNLSVYKRIAPEDLVRKMGNGTVTTDSLRQSVQYLSSLLNITEEEFLRHLGKQGEQIGYDTLRVVFERIQQYPTMTFAEAVSDVPALATVHFRLADKVFSPLDLLQSVGVDLALERLAGIHLQSSMVGSVTQGAVEAGLFITLRQLLPEMSLGATLRLSGLTTGVFFGVTAPESSPNGDEVLYVVEYKGKAIVIPFGEAVNLLEELKQSPQNLQRGAINVCLSWGSMLTSFDHRASDEAQRDQFRVTATEFFGQIQTDFFPGMSLSPLWP